MKPLDVTKSVFEPFEPEIEQLLGIEKEGPGPATDRRRALDTRVFATLGLGATTASAGTASAAVPASSFIGSAAGATAGSAAAEAVAFGKAGVAVVAGALLALTAVGVAFWRTWTAPADAGETTPAMPAVPEKELLAHLEPLPAPPVPGVPNPGGAEAQVRRERPPRQARQLAPPDEPPPAAPASDATALERERVFLEKTRATLRSGNASMTRERLATYRREFPSGALGDEADVLEALALLHLGGVEEASLIVQALRTRSPASLFLPSLDRALGRARNATAGDHGQR